MKKLLSLPPNLVRRTPQGTTVFHDITGLPADEYFCTCDPEGHRVGSGGGTAWLLWQAFLSERGEEHHSSHDWLPKEKRILLHAGGQSRRLPAYAPSGKILTPIPVFRWERGQRLSQDLLSLQLPLYERIMQSAPQGLNTMVVSGDVLIRVGTDQRTPVSLPRVPQADVVCLGMWLDASVAQHHGVFVADQHTPHQLKQMLQKPTVAQLNELQRQHFFLTDIGVWILSDRAVAMLMKKCVVHNPDNDDDIEVRPYDLYSEFGCALGTDPLIDDPELRQLTVAIVPLPDAQFYHFGTSQEMISSMVALQSIVSDQRRIMHHDRKPQDSIFTQNAIMRIAFTGDNRNIWVENSYVGPRWKLTTDNIVTGIPQNDWQVTLNHGQCLDVVPIGDDDYAVRCYHMTDRFDGPEQQRPQFPVLKFHEIGQWLAQSGNRPQEPHAHHLLSAEQISSQANLRRLFDQRRSYRNQNWPAIAANWQHSVFYQLDLNDAEQEFRRNNIPLPPPLPDDAPLMTRIHDDVFRGNDSGAFELLRTAIIGEMMQQRQAPRMAVHPDQIVWARSPVRIDIAGGWTDTPPYCLMEGGNVVNLAIDLNGQQPLQAYAKTCKEPHIVLRSIDLGATEVVTTYDELMQYNKVGSPFSIPKAALSLAGFAPQFAAERFPSLKEQLQHFGGGIELTLLSAIPAGSGLGTSSVLAATVLAAVSDFCALAWDKNEIGRRTLALEQLLTTGGGWQDQFGGILPGVKLLQTEEGLVQQPMARWLPNDIYTQPEYRQCHLLYYTGITRTAKQILAEIVRRMFLNDCRQLAILRRMKQHALEMFETILRQDFVTMGQMVRQNWQLNQLIDSGTNPAAVQRLTDKVDDLCLGYKLPGAGGGGYLYMVAKDPEAAARIRQRLNEHPENHNARFVDMSLSLTGLQVSRS